jgi:phage repressor protein C with HTH and peptisase S24 domain
MSSTFDTEAIRVSLQAAMDRKGIKAKPLAKAASLGETAVRDILEGRSNDPRLGTLHKIAEALEVPLENIIGSARVPLVGHIGAGGAIAYFPTDDMESVIRPPLAVGPMIALEVSGESMLPKYEPGDVIYVRRDHDGVLPEYLGEYCACHLSDGGTYLKILTAGPDGGRYTLRSLNAADMTNVEVIWATPVLFIMPRRSR